MNKKLIFLLFLFTQIEIANAQITVNSWTDSLAFQRFIMLDNDQLVIRRQNGTFLYDDSIQLQLIHNEPLLTHKGRNNNALYPDNNNYSVISWTANGQYTFQGDPQYPFDDPTALIQLSDNRIMLDSDLDIGLIIIDSNSTKLIPRNGEIARYLPIVEINPDLYLLNYSGFGASDTIAYFDRVSETLIKYSSTDIVGSPILGYAKGPGNTAFVLFLDGVAQILEDSVLNVAYFASQNIQFDPVFAGVCSFGQKFLLCDSDYFLIYDSGNLLAFDSADGFYTGGSLPFELLDLYVNSSGVAYFAQSFAMYTISSPLLNLDDDFVQINSAKLYPNPSNGIINIVSDHTFNKIILTDIHGTISYQAHSTDSINRLKLPDHLENGIYVINLINEKKGQYATQKIVISRK